MEKAKAAIKEFTSRTGQHDTTVHETVAPAVQHETVKPHHHENVTTAVDKEVHQDHYHHTVQPIHDREVLPEQHTAKLGDVQHRTFDNRDHEHTKNKLATEHAQFKDERIVTDATRSQTAAPTVGGEHHHHHIHETIQPVVKKEVIQPHVTHTTVPIHETHHLGAQHHGASALPAVSMSEFKERGGVLGGREERYDAFEGEPKNIGGFAQGVKNAVTGHSKHDSHHAGEGVRHEGHHEGLGHNNRELESDRTSGLGSERTGGIGNERTGGIGSERGLGGAERGVERGLTGGQGHESGHLSERTGGGPLDSHKDHAHHGSGRTGDIGNTKHGVEQPGANLGRSAHEGEIGTGVPGFGTHEKSKTGAGPSVGAPSLKDKLDPRVDSNGDGKAGFMK